MLGIGAWKQRMPQPEDALPGRQTPILDPRPHHVTGRSLLPSAFPGSKTLIVGMGCFWGAERKFWNIPGVYTTAVGYAGGYTPNPTYREVCSGQTGHTEAVQIVYDPANVDLSSLLRTFWENHDPTQGMRQGNDVGSQYRSAIYATDAEQLAAAEASRRDYQAQLTRAGYGAISTDIAMAGPFYYAEDEHQQYLSKHPDGYCGLGGTGVVCPIGLDAA
ncbi:MAG TPA: peptide-methionine (S)-S-oxide reductase MsrA [Dyella sp.]|uniref:peptide-methionine (S)-S-oxide reductase MsrA n=1 Tax=Dyella sp. TaxID=1869338 RepID=UPI002F931D2D